MSDVPDIQIIPRLELEEKSAIERKETVLSFRFPYFVALSTCDNGKEIRIWSTKTGKVLKTIDSTSFNVSLSEPLFAGLSKWSSESVLINLKERYSSQIYHYELDITSESYTISRIYSVSVDYVLTKYSRDYNAYIDVRKSKYFIIYDKNGKTFFDRDGKENNGGEVQFSSLYPNSIYYFVRNRGILRLRNYKTQEFYDLKVKKGDPKSSMNCLTSYVNTSHEEIVVVGATIKTAGYAQYSFECLQFYNADKSIQNLKNRVEKYEVLDHSLYLNRKVSCLRVIENKYLVTGSGRPSSDTWDVTVYNLRDPSIPDLRRVTLRVLFPKMISGRADVSTRGMDIISTSRSSCDILHFSNFRMGVFRITGLDLPIMSIHMHLKDLEERINFLREKYVEEEEVSNQVQVVKVIIDGIKFPSSKIFKLLFLM